MLMSPVATQAEKQQADKKNAERAKKQAEEKSKQQKTVAVTARQKTLRL
jgi:hypothetical protein